MQRASLPTRPKMKNEPRRLIATCPRLGCSDRHDEISAHARGELRSARSLGRSTWPTLSRRKNGIVEELDLVIQTPIKKEISEMANLTGFDANLIEPSRSFELLPEGTYVAMITQSEWRETRSKSGHFLQLTFQITDGLFMNRLLWARLNIYNTSPTTRQIAQSELSAICRAVGVLTPNDSSELHGRPLVVRVRRKPRSDTGEVINEIAEYARYEVPVTPILAPAASTQPSWRPPY
jgi:hypothetical protein